MGYIHMLQHQWIRAAEAFAGAATADPGWAAPLSLQADAQRELGQSQQALQFYQRAIAIDPYFPDPWRGISLVRRDEGDNLGAVDALVSGSEESPVREDQAGLSYELAARLWTLGCPGDAEQEWDRAVALNAAQEAARLDWREAQVCAATRERETRDHWPCRFTAGQ
jgi:tetratricopeptide (TPR) repeat protein